MLDIQDNKTINKEQVLQYAPFTTYEIGELTLSEGQVLEIPEGTILRGSIKITHCKNIKLFGQGTLEAVTIAHASDVIIEGIKIINPHSEGRGITIHNSENIQIVDVDVISEHNCIAIEDEKIDTRNKGSITQNIEVSNSKLENGNAGNAIYIGQAGETVRKISIRNIEIIKVDNIGAPFRIYGASDQVIEEIDFDTIEVYHYYYRFFDIRINKAEKDIGKGYIKNLNFHNLSITKSIYNPGYSLSVIGGCDNTHMVEEISFINIRINQSPIKNLDELDIHYRFTKNIKYEKEQII